MAILRVGSVTPRFMASPALGTVGAILTTATAVVKIAVPGMPTDGVLSINLPSIEAGLLISAPTYEAATGKLQFGITNSTGSTVTPSPTQTVWVIVH